MQFKHGYNRYNNKDYISNTEGSYDYYEGKSIGQFDLRKPLKTNVDKFITKDLSIAIRYNSRNTDIRTIIASILPKNVCYDESLMVESSNLPYDIKYYMVAILNSFVVDFYIKKLSSRHVTSYILNMPPMPQYNDVERFNLISNTSRYLINKNLNISEHMSLRNKLDALIAHLFNLSYEEFKYILEEFKISNNQRDDMLNHYTKYTY